MRLQHSFVDTVPHVLEPGLLYISIRYRTASHLCPCGCNNRVVTPLRPERWHLEYDGEAVSLSPSIGNWGLPCQSHYWITGDEVVWSYRMSDKEIDNVRIDERQRIAQHYAKRTRSQWWHKLLRRR